MKKKFYLTLDTETATLPFVNLIAADALQKQRVSLAKPLVYDIGWVITDRKGGVVKSENFLVQETFFVPQVFNTAYYREKRPIYMSMYQSGAIKAACWNDIVNVLLEDLRSVDMVMAYNATFDFKKSIPFTERYIKHLYSDDYPDWEKRQFKRCKAIAKGDKPGENPTFMDPYFELRNERFPIADLWAIACDRLINIDKYRNFCLQNSLLTASAEYFKTSAETSFQYLAKQHDFTEAHTALSDAEIEAQLVTKALRKGKIEPVLKAFPFRELGTTIQYVREKQPRYIDVVLENLDNYLENNISRRDTGYYTAMLNKRNALERDKETLQMRKKRKK